MSVSNPNLPKAVLALRSYSRQAFLHDLLAGITVGLVALPLAMAFGIASGVTPQAGLYTAVVAGFLISALGGSRTQIGGPTGAFVVIVAGIVARFGMSGLAMVTAMAGSKAEAWIRVTNNDVSLIKAALDTGATTIVVPMVTTRAEAEQAVAAAKYPPLGIRGFGPFRPPYQWRTSMADYAKRANESPL